MDDTQPRRTAEAEGLDREIAEAIARAAGSSVSQLGLRLDRVVIRVLGRLRRYAEDAAPSGTTIVVTITAPIGSPAKTAVALEAEIEALVFAGDAHPTRDLSLYGNAVQVRLAAHSPARAHKLVGFVHNRGVAAVELLDLAEAWLRGDD